MTDREQDDGFLSRWSRRKAQARRAAAVSEKAMAPATSEERITSGQAKSGPTPLKVEPAEVQRGEPLPTLADVAQLTPASDFSRFVADGVDANVKNAALSKLFADPHFNVMDGLDVYIDDYGRPDPVPASMLAKIAQAKFLGLVVDGGEEPAVRGTDVLKHDANDIEPSLACADAIPPEEIAADENTDLQLQPHDATGRAGAEPGAGEDSGCEQRRTG
jgi:hypothetical protein